MNPITVRVLQADEAHVLDRVADGVFDGPVQPEWCAEFFRDPRSYLAVALDGDVVVGMASALVHVHPDKAPQLWVNEVGVAPSHQRRGLGRQLLAAVLELARSLGCSEAWVATEDSNLAARGLYAAAGGEEAPEGVVMFTFRLLEPDAPPT